MAERPSGAFALLLVAGSLILFLGLLVTYLFYTHRYRSASENGGMNIKTDMFVYWNAIICGVVVSTAGILLYVFPKHHVNLGIISFIFSILSIFSWGGLGVGMLLGIIGSTLSIGWRPGPKPEPILPKYD